MITDTIGKQITEALKAKDEIRLSTLRMLSSALNYERIAKQHDLSQEEELVVIQKEVKKRKDAIEAYQKAGAADRAEKEKQESVVLEEFLPEQMDDRELAQLVEAAIAETGATSLADMGKVIGMVKAKVGPAADGGRIAQAVKQKLS